MIVWSPDTCCRYARRLGIPPTKIVAERFHHTLRGYENVSVQNGDYIFSGGDSMRDYATLLKSVDGLNVPVVVATRLKLDSRLNVPKNVTVGPVSSAEFRQLMAGAALVVLPLNTSALRSSGQQSFLNAMALGKAVIVTDTRDAPFYIENDVTGLCTPSGDSDALRTAIIRLIGSPERIRKMGEAAKLAAAPLDQEYTWSRVLAHALECHERRLSRGT
jgi:glycosyltransferase involved in cell wall biosynthesis